MDTSDLSDATNFDTAELQKVTLMNIQQLQKMEQKLFSDLESAAANDPSNTSAQDAIVKKINELSAMRMTMFGQLENVYKDMQGRVAQSRIDLVDQMTVTGVVEGQLNNAKASLNTLSDNKNQKMRMVEINTYYSEKYRAQTDLVKTIIMFAIPCLILAIVIKKGFIPANIGKLAIYAISIIGAIVVLRKWMDISSRSNMNFDEYKWDWDANANKPTVLEYDEEQIEGSTMAEDTLKSFEKEIGLGCVGQDCCSDGTKWDKTTEKCIEGFSGITQVESRNAVCPWKNSASTVKAFTPVDNYERI